MCVCLKTWNECVVQVWENKDYAAMLNGGLLLLLDGGLRTCDDMVAVNEWWVYTLYNVRNDKGWHCES